MKRQRATANVGIVNTDGHVIGLDIGATAVRAAILAPARPDDPDQLMTIEDMGEAALPEGTVVDGVVIEPASLTRVLAEMWKRHDFGCRRVIIGISNAQVVVRALQMPRLPPDQLARALPFQAREVVALPLDQALLDFRPLPETDEEAAGDVVNGLLIAAPRLPVLTVVRAVEAAGLRIARVDLASFAALRSAASPELDAEAVVDIGAQVTNIVIHRHGVPTVVRTLGRGGQQLTERLVERTGVSTSEAEIMKREIGVVGGDSEAGMILASALRPLVADIRSSVQYFSTTNGSASLERVSLTGGGAQLPGLLEALSDDIGVRCRLVSPMQHVRRIAAAPDGRQPGGRHPEGRHLDDSYPDDTYLDDTDEMPYPVSAVSVGLALGAAA